MPQQSSGPLNPRLSVACALVHVFSYFRRVSTILAINDCCYSAEFAGLVELVVELDTIKRWLPVDKSAPTIDRNNRNDAPAFRRECVDFFDERVEIVLLSI